MKEILAALAAAMTTLKERANAALAPLGPVDQFEGAGEVAYALRTLKYAQSEVENMLSQATQVMAKYDPEVAAAAAKLVDATVEEKVAAGELMKKADAETAINLAKDAGREEAAAAFKIEKEQMETVAARRTALTTTHGADAVSVLAEEFFKGEDAAYAKNTQEFGRRVAALSGMGVDPATKKKAFADIACCAAFDDDGAAAFDGRIEAIKDLVPKGGVRQTVAAQHKGVPPVTNPDDGGASKPKPTFAF